MGFFDNMFKSKELIEMERQDKQEEALRSFEEQIANLEQQRNKYATIAAKAEINGDDATYQLVCNNMLELNGMISSLNQAYASYDIMNTMNTIALSMGTAMAALGTMADNKSQLPNIKEIQKVNAKINSYMKNVKITNKTIASMMSKANPAVKTRTPEELASIRPMIDAARSKMVLESTPRIPVNDISAEIESEKQRLV